MNKTNLALVLATVAVIIAIGGYFYPQVQSAFGGGTRFPNGISADTTSPVTGEVRGTTLTITSAASFAGLLTTNAGQLKSYTNATSSVTSGTLKVSDVQGYDTVLLTPTGAASTKTLTFFASSTASTWLPTAGDRQDTCFVNSTTTAATTITFAAGTGIDLEVASSTTVGATPTLVIPADSTVCFTFIRKPATDTTFDIEAAMTRFVDGD